jgi:hypothetical protein
MLRYDLSVKMLQKVMKSVYLRLEIARMRCNQLDRTTYCRKCCRPSGHLVSDVKYTVL